MQKVDIRSQLKNILLFKKDAFINGKWIHSKNTFKLKNPAADEMIATVANLDSSAAELAVAAAAKALPAWRATSYPKNVRSSCVNGLI